MPKAQDRVKIDIESQLPQINGNNITNKVDDHGTAVYQGPKLQKGSSSPAMREHIYRGVKNINLLIFNFFHKIPSRGPSGNYPRYPQQVFFAIG